MDAYHFHNPEKMFAERAELIEIIEAARFMTLAMCHQGEPYITTMNYGFDPDRNCFFFHCAGEGRKLEYLRASPVVWGQIIEDRGYVPGKCDHAYRSVHFSGRVTFLETSAEKDVALELMIRQLEPDPEPVVQRLMARRTRIAQTTVGRIDVLQMTGKRNALEML
jgi:uncharacterized protein